MSTQELRALRNARNITVREVELESQRIAEAKNDKRFYISNARLTQLENDPLSEPSLWKLFSLSAIYRVGITDLMRLYNVDADESDKYVAIATADRTQLLADVPKSWRGTKPLERVSNPSRQTVLLPRQHLEKGNKSNVTALEHQSRHTAYGYIGLEDLTMYPLIRPGSFVWIDTRETKLRLIPWHSEYDRPIYFIELRDSYACGWCELQENQLLIIPHQSSPVNIRRVTYSKDAEIVGRVMMFRTPCIDEVFSD